MTLCVPTSDCQSGSRSGGPKFRVDPVQDRLLDPVHCEPTLYFYYWGEVRVSPAFLRYLNVCISRPRRSLLDQWRGRTPVLGGSGACFITIPSRPMAGADSGVGRVRGVLPTADV